MRHTVFIHCTYSCYIALITRFLHTIFGSAARNITNIVIVQRPAISAASPIKKAQT